MISAVLHRAAVAPTYVISGPPLIIAAALGLAVHHHRTRKNHR